ncbi:MAG: hypothetical protein JXA15_05040 [Spirochaetales bacterium]|nr:hypothetical protein [Spirochaetales bacterium]
MRKQGSAASSFPVTALAVLALAAAGPAIAQGAESAPFVPKTPVATALPDGSYELAFDVPEGYGLVYAAWHPAGARVALYRRNGGGSRSLWVDLGYGLEGPFEHVDNPVFSADGRRAACSAQTAYEEHWVLEGGRRSGPWSDVTRTAFSPDSSRFLFVGYVRGTGATEVVVDFESRGRGREPGFFSGSRWFFRSYEDGWSVVTDSGVSGPWDYIANVRVAPDGSDIMYRVTDAEGRLWICTADRSYGPFPTFPTFPPNGAEEPGGRGIVMDLSDLPLLEPGFAPDGRTPRFFVREERGGTYAWTVYDGDTVAGGPWAEPGNLAARPVPSPDLKRAAFIVREGEKYYIEESTGRLGPFGDVRRLAYSADGSTFAAQVRGAAWDEWIYGSGFKLGPYRNLGSWELVADGSLAVVWNGSRYDRSSAASFRTREGELAPFDAALVPESTIFGTGLRSEPSGDGMLVRGESGSFGPYEGLSRIYAGTPGGGALYATKAAGSWTLWADGKALVSLEGGSLSESSSNLDDGLVPIVSGDGTVGLVAVAGGLARFLVLFDAATGAGRWIPIGGEE